MQHVTHAIDCDLDEDCMCGAQEKHVTHQIGAMVQDAGARKFRDGVIIESEHTGARYRLEHVQQFSATFRREVPKVRGKAARRADKLARRSRPLL